MKQQEPEADRLADLLARVEAATGPDRELDAHVWALEAGVDFDERADIPYPAYTASLDAALALVERVLPGWFVGFQQNAHVPDERRWSAWVQRLELPRSAEIEGVRPTVPLALLAALLRALSDTKGTKHG